MAEHDNTPIEDDVKTATCKRCGRDLPIESFRFVKYKGQEPKYRFTVCRDCQNIESRRRYLEAHKPDSEALKKINRLYAKHEAEGRSIPTRHKSDPDKLLDELLAN